MNEPGEVMTVLSERQDSPPELSFVQSRTAPNTTDFRMMELEIENSRLQRLVAELLLKNQQLRKARE